MAGLVAALLVGFGPHIGKQASSTPATRLERAEQAALGGDSSTAHTLLDEAAGDGESARLHLVRGTLAFADHHVEQGLAEYRSAIALDPASRTDAGLLRQMRTLFDGEKQALVAVRFVSADLGAPGCGLLKRAASNSRLGDVRRAARVALDRVGCRKAKDP